jgi:hypothetical protein
MPIARIARSTTLSLREREYVEAARAMGASDLRIIRRHILPNTVRPIIVAASVMTAGAVILETTLSFLGVGISRYAQGRTDTQLPSLGDVAAAATGEGLFNWWGILFPGLAILLIVVPIYFIGDGIGDALDPTGRLAARTPAPRRRRRSRVVTRAVSRIPRRTVPAVPMPRVRIELPLVGRREGVVLVQLIARRPDVGATRARRQGVGEPASADRRRAHLRLRRHDRLRRLYRAGGGRRRRLSALDRHA